MPSSITLTVSHLPTSTSFFLSALQSLDYAYRGRSNNTIGFGSTTNPSAPADFWITQEIPGVPVGAAHVAFQAASRVAVQQFFAAALKAGGIIHGEPAVRDSSGYYSAAVIDFDGNSIEAVFRPDFSDDKENDVKSTLSSKATTIVGSDIRSQVSHAPPSDVKSSISRSPSAAEASTPVRKSPGSMLEGLVSDTRSAANVARTLIESVSNTPPSQPRPSGESESNAILGTLLGVAAGAALHYAFTHEKDRKPRPSLARSVTEPSHHQSHHHLEGPQYLALEDNDYASTVRPIARSTASSHRTSNAGGGARGQLVYSTPFGTASHSIAPSQRSTTQRMLEAPHSASPSSSKPHHTSTPSQLSRSSSSHHTLKPTMTATASQTPRSQTTRRPPYERSVTAKLPSPTAITSTSTSSTTTHRHHVLRTTSESLLEVRPPVSTAAASRPPPPPSASPAPAPTPAPAAPTRPIPLSEANLKRATTAPDTAAAPRGAVSLHSRNRESEEYPIDLSREKTGKGSSRSGRESRTGSRRDGGGKSNSGSGTSKKMELEVTPEDSVSQVSSVRSVCTVRAGSRR